MTKPSLSLKIDRGWGRVFSFKVREIRETYICRKKDMGRGKVRECVKFLMTRKAIP